jgi:hypothetical protein
MKFQKDVRLPGEGFYTQVPTHWIRDHRLTGNAVRLLSFWQSHEIGYEVTIKQTIAETGMGRDAVYAAVKVLVKFSYLVRAQGRSDDGRMADVQYTFGPAAAEQQYDRAWGKTAGQTAYGKAASGETVYGGSAPKKNKVKEDQGKEDHPPYPPTTPAAADPVPEQSNPGGPESSQEDNPNTDTDLVAEIRKVRPEWSPSSIRRALAHPDVACRPAELVRRAALAVAADPATEKPGRLAQSGPWWSVQQGAPAAPEQRRPEWCGECDERTRQVVDAEDRPARCSACHPMLVGEPVMAGGVTHKGAPI